MERKRSNSSEEDVTDSRKCKKKFTEIESIVEDEAGAKCFDKPLSDEYQPQFFNYQLIGDLLAVAILNSKDLIIERKYYVPVEPVRRLRFCDEAWSVQDLLLEMKSKKSRYPIAENVMLSVGYNDCCSNSMNPEMFVECLGKIIKKLCRRGCKEIILTNVPPCGIECDNVNHWKYLQIINEEIFKLSETYEYIGHCDIFRLFCKPKNLFSPHKDYVSGSEINFKVDFSMYNEVGFYDEIDLINFSNLAKIVLGKHVAKIIEKRKEYLRYGQVDKVICVLKEASDVEDSDSEGEAVVIVKTDDAGKGGAVISLDSSDEEEAGGNRPGDSDVKNEVPQENVLLGQEISTVEKERLSCEMPPEDHHSKQAISCSINNVDDIKVEKTLCEKPQEDQRSKQAISCSINNVDDIKIEKTSCEKPPEDQQMKQAVISCGIQSVDDSNIEGTSEKPPKDQQMKQAVISCSIERVDDIKIGKTSSEMPPQGQQMKPVISTGVNSVDDINSEETSCLVPLEEKRIEPVIFSSTDIAGDELDENPSRQMLPEAERPFQVISCSITRVDNTEDVNPSSKMPLKNSKQEIVGNCEESERMRQIPSEPVSSIDRSEPIKQELVSTEPVKVEITCNVENSEPTRQEIVSEKSADIKDEKRSFEMSQKDGLSTRVILCNFKKLGPDIAKPSYDGFQADCLSKPTILNSHEKLDIKDEKRSGEIPKSLPLPQVIFCSIRGLDLEKEKPSLKREK